MPARIFSGIDQVRPVRLFARALRRVGRNGCRPSAMRPLFPFFVSNSMLIYLADWRGTVRTERRLPRSRSFGNGPPPRRHLALCTAPRARGRCRPW
eukprot:5699841-Pyramimonas_sp.AAC.1